KSLYDLAQWVVLQQGLASYLSETQTGDILTAIEQDKPPVEVDGEIWNEWQSRLREHIQAFGYILYNLDFAEPVPAEDPTPSLEIIKVYLRGEGADPHQRQSRLEQQRLEATQTLLDRARGPRGWVVRKALGWAQAMAEVREDSIASIGLAYPLLRELLRELGLRFIEAGAIQEPEDIYWLEEKEIEESI
ncbi:MAG: phosphoenolpyruvate synthase, partial [Anaerolineae bacterium]|nr:phosphoenolpyruvate synthase [Anaerolineae bacterium]